MHAIVEKEEKIREGGEEKRKRREGEVRGVDQDDPWEAEIDQSECPISTTQDRSKYQWRAKEYARH